MAASGLLWRTDALAGERFPPPFQGALCSAAPFRSRGCGAAACLRMVVLIVPDLLCLLGRGTLQATFFFFFLENHLTANVKKRGF